jgi:hypothetical protein
MSWAELKKHLQQLPSGASNAYSSDSLVLQVVLVLDMVAVLLASITARQYGGSGNLIVHMHSPSCTFTAQGSLWRLTPQISNSGTR